jgi:RNA polymerase sigma-54 factor
MAFDLKLQMKLGQQMVMTPQLQQAIKLLQMNRLELSETIQGELLENPLLEEGNEISELDQKKAEVEQSENPLETKEVSPDQDKNPDFDWDNYMEQSFSYTGKSSGGLGKDHSAEEGPSFESVASKKMSLNEHLLAQVTLSDFSPEEREVSLIILGALDEWGYLKEPIEDIAKKCEVEPDFADLVLRMMQEFDPPGVCARDLKECLMLQLKVKKAGRRSDRDLVIELVEKHLHNLEKKNFKVILKDMGLEMDELGELMKLLQGLEPRPGRPFVELENRYITPDIHINKVNNEFVISLNEDGLPKLKISNLYRNVLKTMPEAESVAKKAMKAENVEAELSALSEGAEAKENGKTTQAEKENPREYIQNKLRGALWLIRSIHQRQRTIYKVTESIVKSQRDFLEKGVTHLKPMVLKDVAADIGMHESTISRVTSNKYVHTPQGTYELKFFFSSSIPRSDGRGIASESVKEKIRLIVKDENNSSPISDQGIVEELRKQGIEIARRTVAKYREMLGILPSSQRKSLFK